MERDGALHRGGLVTPLALIALGVVFLLSNLGYLAWSPWEAVSRLWPLLIVAAGLDLLLGRGSPVGPWTIFGLLMLVALLVAAGSVGSWLLAPQRVVGWTTNGPEVMLAGPVSSESFNQPLEGAQRADVTLSFGAGNLTIAAQNDPSGLIEGTVTRYQGERLSRDAHNQGDALFFEMHDEKVPFSIGDNHGMRGEDRGWDLQLNPTVPMRLRVDTGVSQAKLDLEQLKLTDLTVHTGVGKTNLTLPQSGQFQATVEGGVGETVVLIPQGMAARIRVDTGLGSSDVMGNFQRQGNSYVSPGYEGAGNRVDLTVKGGIGKITVQELSLR